MKLQYKFMLLLLIVGVIFVGQTQKVCAQSELIVEWADANGDIIVNALLDAINTDTERPADRVYVLRKGGYYWLTDRIENTDFHLRIVGETPDPNDTYGNPAIIQMVADAEGGVDGRIITGLNDLTIKNVWITGADDAGVQTYYQPMQMDASGARFVLDNVIFDRSNFAMMAFTGSGNDIFFTNCTFRNLIGQPSTQQWEGRGISIWADQDTVVVENCTFFQIGMTAFQLEGGAAQYVRFNHNTIVNLGRGITSGNWWINGYFANNLIINGFWHGEGHGDLTDPNRVPGQWAASLFQVGDLPSAYGPEAGRRIVFANTAAFLDQQFKTYYGDSIRVQPFMNELQLARHVDVNDAMVAQDTTWLTAEPGLAVYPDEEFPNMIQNISDLRDGITPAQPYFYQLPEFDGEVCHVCVSWPLPEDFSYTNATLLTAGTDGLPLGDLNWFPTQKAQFLADQAANVKSVESLAGKVIKLTPVSTIEAEDGTLAGDATVAPFEGFAYFQMDGGGYIEWDFDLAAAGQYDLNVWTNLRGNGTRGQRIIVNGVSIHDPMGWGEYIWSPSEQSANIWYGVIPNNEWCWTQITQAEILEAGALTLPAGPNVIRIEASWGWQNFAGIDVIDFASQTVVKELRGPNVSSFNIVTPVGEGAAWTPSFFKSVAIGASGSVAVPIEAAAAGNYRVQLYYENSVGAATGTLLIDGTEAATFDYNYVEDGSGSNTLTSTFALTAGSHTLTVTGSNVYIDQIQLIQEIVESVNKVRELPTGYALSENYPNPFNPTTNIEFKVGKLSNVELSVFNVLGQKVATLVNARMQPGNYIAQWDASHMSTGLYFYTMKVDNHQKTYKMMLVK